MTPTQRKSVASTLFGNLRGKITRISQITVSLIMQFCSTFVFPRLNEYATITIFSQCKIYRRYIRPEGAPVKILFYCCYLLLRFI